MSRNIKCGTFLFELKIVVLQLEPPLNLNLFSVNATKRVIKEDSCLEMCHENVYGGWFSTLVPQVKLDPLFKIYVNFSTFFSKCNWWRLFWDSNVDFFRLDLSFPNFCLTKYLILHFHYTVLIILLCLVLLKSQISFIFSKHLSSLMAYRFLLHLW